MRHLRGEFRESSSTPVNQIKSNQINMKTNLTNHSGKQLALLLLMFLFKITYSYGTATGQMSVTQCGAGSNYIEFQIDFNNNSTAGETIYLNSVAPIRINHAAGIVPAGTNTFTWAYVPGTASASFAPMYATLLTTYNVQYTPASRLMQVTNSSSVFGNSASAQNCPVAPGATISAGKFRLTITNTNFVAGQNVGLTWVTTSGFVGYVNTNPATQSFNTTAVRTLNAPCTMSIPAACNLSASVVTNAVSCNGGSNGSATVSVTGGTGASTYLWSNGATTATATGLAAGAYSVTVTNGSCTASASGTVSQPSALSVSATAGTIACAGGTTTVTVSASGGTAPYTGTGAFTASAGTSSYGVGDANGCSGSASVTIADGAPVTSNSTSQSACDSYTWSVDNTTYTQSGTYSSVSGCNTEILVLTITPSTSNTTTASVCDSYTWSVNNTTYTESGTYSSVNGCNTEILALTVTPSTSNATTQSACDSYTWSVDNTTYTQSGTYSSVNGCHTEILNLTVTPSTSNSTSASVCDSYTWSVDNTTYTQSGTYSSVTGCHTEILNLTVTPSTSNATSQTACDSYIWSVNNATYTQSGTYSSVNGCHTEILNLTINSSSSNTTTITSCSSYTWSVDNVTYTQSGTYSSVNGCATEILVLTISPLSATATLSAPIACFGGSATIVVSATGGTAPYIGTGAQVAGAGTVSYTVADDNGCTAVTNAIDVIEPAKVQGVATATDANCGQNDGSVTVSATGGTGSYSYAWSNGASTVTASNLSAGAYTVTITDANGCTGTASATVNSIGTGAGNAGAIAGAAGACRSTTAVYSISAVSGATSYSWLLPAGATGSSSSNSITVSFGANYNGGFICVTPLNACGNGNQSCINVPVITVKPAQPAAINGPAIACGPGTFTYSIASVANATNYVWSVNNTAVSIISGQGTNSIQISVPSGFTSVTVGVAAANCVGTSSSRFLVVYGNPVFTSNLAGPAYVCPSSTANYSVGAATGTGISYSWAVTSGNASIQSSNGVSCVLATAANWNGGVITCTASNSCGSVTRTFTVYKTPLQPGAIAGTANNLCLAAGVNTATYSIAAVSGASSYNWTVPAGMTITSNTGLSVTVSIGSSFNSGNLCVTANGACGNSPARCLAVSKAPAAPVVTGASSVCKSQSAVAYSATAVAGANSYVWSVTGGASIAGTSASATANFTTATATSTVIAASAVNQCGASQAGRLSVAVNLLCRDAQNAVQQSVTAFPNPASGKVTVNFTAPVADRYMVRLVDLLGKQLYSADVNAVEGLNVKEIDLSGFAKGIYLLNIQTEAGEAQTLRLVVE